jgi:hypothetical protein
LISQSGDLIQDKLTDLLTLCEVEHSFVPKKDFAATDVANTLELLLKTNFKFNIEESEMKLALGALKAGCDALGLV